MIPNLIHFCFGLSPDFGDRRFSFVHYLAVKTASEVNRPDAIRFHFEHEPTGYWWNLAKPYLSLNKIQAPTEIFGNPLAHYAHRADVVRLQALLREGGIYLDIDVICLKSFEPLRKHDCVMGWEKPSESLCNAVILAKPNAEFLKRWLERYRDFRSKGRDAYWAEHSVTVPARLAKEFPKLIHTVDEKSFFFPYYDRPELLFSNEIVDYSASYCLHLWETLWWEPHLRRLTPYSVKRGRTPFSKMLGPYASGVRGSTPTLDALAYWTKRIRSAFRPRHRWEDFTRRLRIAWQFGNLSRRKLPEGAWILDIGGRGTRRKRWLPGWGGDVEIRTLDLYGEADYRDDAATLATFPDESLDGIYTSHLIEHFWWWQTDDLLRLWLRKLKPGARIEIRCPDMEWIFRRGIAGGKDADVWDDVLLTTAYGSAVIPWSPVYQAPGQIHRNLFWKAKLFRAMEEAGFVGMKRLRYGEELYDRWPYDLRWADQHGKHTVVDLVVEGYKPSRPAVARNRFRETFTKIYEKKLWGKHPDRFYSGPGSDERNAEPLRRYVARFLVENGVRSVVDIGCGDFRATKGLIKEGVRYVGVDVVPSLIEHNRKTFGSPTIEFRVADIVEDPLPPGDLCLVRQVLQHLGNRDVMRVLRKLAGYRYVLITEHQPAPERLYAPNLDIRGGEHTRVDAGSGLYLDKEPFALKGIRTVLETDLGAWGKLTTYLWENSKVEEFLSVSRA